MRKQIRRTFSRESRWSVALAAVAASAAILAVSPSASAAVPASEQTSPTVQRVSEKSAESRSSASGSVLTRADKDAIGMSRASAAADTCRWTVLQEWLSPQNLTAAEWRESGDRLGMLRARTPVQDWGDWEDFVVCRNSGTGAYYFANFDPVRQQYFYVTAEQDYTGHLAGMLRARTPVSNPVREWELFFAERQGDGSWALRAYQDKDGTPYVAAEKGGYSGPDAHMLRARSASVGEWEKFNIPGLPLSG
jgi:hypothetical protein